MRQEPMNPLLSIIIPTKNRHEYLRVVLNILVKFKDSDVEIVIQDNSDEGEQRQDFLGLIKQLDDARIRYYYCEENLSINENSDKAVLNSRGKFICFIGDDDCVTSCIVDAARWMERCSIDVISLDCPTYIWTDVEYKHLRSKRMGLLSFSKPKGTIISKTPYSELIKLLKIGGQSLKELPQLYHGIVSREILDKIYSRTGSFFPGSVPDMDVAVCLSLYARKHYKIDIPLVISGTAKRSAGGLGAANQHKGEIRKIPFLPKDTADFWDPNNPFFWSAPTIYADSVYKCLVRTGNEEMLTEFNYDYLYASLLTFNSDYSKEIFRKIKSNKKSSYLRILYYLTKLFIFRSYIFVKNRIPLSLDTDHKTVNLLTLQEAELYIEGIITSAELPWKE